MATLCTIEDVPVLIRQLLAISSVACVRISKVGRSCTKSLFVLLFKLLHELSIEYLNSVFQYVDIHENYQLNGNKESS